MNEARILIAGALIKKDNLSPQELHQATHVPLIQIYRAVKEMVNDKLIRIEERDDNKLYHITNLKALEEFATNNEEVKTETPAKSPASGRDTSKYIFQKETLPKGRCAHAVVKAYLAKNPSSLKQLQEVFPNEVIGRFGIVNSLSAAKSLSKDRPRYFMKDDQILTATDGPIVVCSQWTSERFEKFMSIAKGLGYKIKRA